VNLNMTWSADEAIATPTNGNLSLGGGITSGDNLFKTGAGTLTLGGGDAIESMDINGGTTTITGNTTLNGNGVGYDRFYLGDGDTVAHSSGTLIIQPGAILDVIGSFNDAVVIGRDGGSGTVIQNGGIFTFNPNASPGYLFVGATSNPGTQSAYDMNGGVLDMSGHTLSIALDGNGGVTTTDVVDQIDGVITNVGNLWISPVDGGGLGIYTLSGGSIYIEGGGITTATGNYAINLGGGTVGAEASWASSLNMNLTGSNGPVAFNPAGNTVTLSGTVSGSGGLTVAGGGTLDLSGAVSYAGNTTVNTSTTLELDQTGSSAGAFHLVNGALLDLTYSGTFVVGGCYTNGVPLSVGVYTSANLPGFITGSGSLTITAATAPVVNRPTVSGGNLILTGSGGTAGDPYTWLTSTNLRTPIALWVTNTTGSFDGSGNFSNAIPISLSTPAKFFRLRTP